MFPMLLPIIPVNFLIIPANSFINVIAFCMRCFYSWSACFEQTCSDSADDGCTNSTFATQVGKNSLGFFESSQGNFQACVQLTI